jgi:class 3 adenylate cyclase/tetratricopeptide (TPR) repeat protein
VADTLLCAACGSANEAGRKFCGECGTAIARACPSCGTPNAPSVKFCGECGAGLSSSTATPADPARGAPAAERRLVSVLFVDLVGFTAASEERDAEDTRELLTRYFDLARTIVGRYGGTIEKFIGDAVMAVWGAPVAQEDDAERAVRAALDLVAAVQELDPTLTARAGVMTGEAAVTIGADGQGMVAGDLVNTASRVQSTAEVGAVLVGQATRRASEAAIAFEDAGEHEVKGKAEPMTLFRALRVTAGRGGDRKSIGLEAPFVGRESELRLVKDLFHATADESRARLVSVVGVAGVGKSRLAWEFFKYVDGLTEGIWWHHGRCLAYGDGVAYWALAEMVRGRIGALEDDDPRTTATRLRETLAAHFADAEERSWVEQRVLPLVGLGERAPSVDREDLFPAWRRFFERLAEQGPLVLVFEDLHWADEGLVAFVEHLLDWSRGLAIFVMTLSRAEIVERHPGFPGATRSSTTLPLEPLTGESMDALLQGLVPGLPDEVRSRIRERADGIPLYAVETVRMLLDRGLLELAGSEYRITGPVESLEVPETLHALIASRLDGLPEDEHRVLQDAAVLGKTFTRRGLAALSGLSEEAIEPLVGALRRKELLYLETDARSAERGQLGFLQALVQRVAYETLSRRERRSRHLAAATFLARDSGMDPTEIAEVIAAHYLDAYRADEGANDAAETKASARTWFVRAAERARSLAAAAEAQRGLERAAELADDEVERAGLLHRAGEMAWMASDLDAVERHLTEAITIFRGAGRALEEARASSKIADLLSYKGRMEEAVEVMERALEVFEASGDEAAMATVSVQLGRFLLFEGERERALECVELGLELAERLRLPEAISQGLNTKGIVLRGRPQESIALMRGALAVAREHDLNDAIARAYINLGFLLWISGASNDEIEQVTREGLAHSRRRGDREGELNFVAQLTGGLYDEGRWDEIQELAAELPEEALERVGSPVGFQLPAYLAEIARQRGDAADAKALMASWATSEPFANHQAEACRVWALAFTALVEERFEDVLVLVRPGIEAPANPAVLESHLDLAGEAVRDAAGADTLAELLDLADAADVAKPPTSLAGIEYLRAKAAALRGEEPEFERAVALLRESDRRVTLAMALVEQAEWLVSRGRQNEAAPLLAEARESFERLRARTWLERVDAVAAPSAEVTA